MKRREAAEDEHTICKTCRVQTYIPCELANQAYEKGVDLTECKGLKEHSERLIDVLDPGNIKARKR